jgi:eukaryotic-like serine/threonine-protein kinase
MGARRNGAATRPKIMATQTTSTTSRSSRDPYLGKVVAGRYRLEARLGEGGMGVVYRARHVLIDRVVALKLIRPDLRGETHLRAWMLREARAANRVDHAHIVEIHDVGETDDGELYLVMEYLVGTALSSEISKGPMPVSTGGGRHRADVRGTFARPRPRRRPPRPQERQHHAHRARGARRLREDPRLRARPTWRATRVSRPAAPSSAPPSTCRPSRPAAKTCAVASDLYALGILFFEMSTGQLPFKSSDRDTLLEMQRSAPAPRPRSLRKDRARSGGAHHSAACSRRTPAGVSGTGTT